MWKVFVVAALVPFFSFAEPRVSVSVDGRHYSCNPGQGGALDPSCIQNLTTLCKNETPQSGGTCFDRATVACKDKPFGYSDCVGQTTRTCKAQTPMSGAACFERALSACTGGTDGADAIEELLEAANQAR